MPSGEASGYISFMQWFQNTHPDLYTCCWQEIIPPVKGKIVTVNKDGMDEGMYMDVMNAVQEYYSGAHD